MSVVLYPFSRAKAVPLVPEMKRCCHAAQLPHAAAALIARTTSSKHPKLYPVLLLKPFLLKTSSLFLNRDKIHLPCPTENQRCQQNTSQCAQVAPVGIMLKSKMHWTVLLSPCRIKMQFHLHPRHGAGGLFNSPFPKAGAHRTRNPLRQATVKSEKHLLNVL